MADLHVPVLRVAPEHHSKPSGRRYCHCCTAPTETPALDPVDIKQVQHAKLYNYIHEQKYISEKVSEL